MCSNWMNIKIIIWSERSQKRCESTLPVIIYIKFYKMQRKTDERFWGHKVGSERDREGDFKEAGGNLGG